MIILALISWALAAVCNAVMDVVAFKFKRSVFRELNPFWWNPAKSWKNKYKGREPGNGPAYAGSTTVLCFTTDAWHLFQFGMTLFMALSFIFVCQVEINLNIVSTLAILLGLKVLWGLVFELFYSKILRRNGILRRSDSSPRNKGIRHRSSKSRKPK